MSKQIKYVIITVESYPHGFDVKHFYLPVQDSLKIGDIITHNSGHQYRIIDGKTQVDFKDIDQSIYISFN